LNFDIAEYISANPSYFKPGSSVDISLDLSKYDGADQVKLASSVMIRYYDSELPAATGNLPIEFTVLQKQDDSILLGKDSMTGKGFSYELTVLNKSPDPLGMVVAIYRVPACLSIVFDHL
jgi:hypothetical protein